MTRKPIEEWQPGDFITDMHDGLEPVRRAGLDVVSHTKWEEPESNRAGWTGFSEYLSAFGMYTNKSLVMLGWADDSTLTNPAIVAGYCYDGRRSGVVVLRRKAAQP